MTIRERRKAISVSQDELAVVAGVGHSTIWSAETGRACSNKTRKKILTALRKLESQKASEYNIERTAKGEHLKFDFVSRDWKPIPTNIETVPTITIGETVSMTEAANRLRITKRGAKYHVQTGRLQAEKDGNGEWRISTVSLEDLAAELKAITRWNTCHACDNGIAWSPDNKPFRCPICGGTGKGKT
ncbi:MAG: hypothetical protein GY833_16525 [Aestuariibacter sp.]|nr:hypothetical protein [Aestuariibacter sp.]